MILIDKRWESLTPEEKMNEELSKAITSYDKLLVAASYGNLPLASELINQGTRINPDSEMFTATPLYYAAHNGHLEMVQFLVSKGADVNLGSTRHLDNTPLKIAIANKHLNVISCLLENHANVNHITQWGHTALDDALWHAKLHPSIFTEKVLGLLIDAGADLHINETSSEKRFESAKCDINSWSPLTKKEKLERIAVLEKIFLSPVKENYLVRKWKALNNPVGMAYSIINNSAIFSGGKNVFSQFAVTEFGRNSLATGRPQQLSIPHKFAGLKK